MLVTTARIGHSLRNERSLSSASATKYSDLPTRAFEPMASTRPPMTTVGSRPPAASTAATIEVVVVLPCMPAMAMPYFRRISSASISARGITGMWLSVRGGDLGIVARDRGAGHHHFGACKILRAMAFEGEGAHGGQAMGDGRGFQVRAGNLVAEVQQHLGDAAHADAADTDEMNALNFGKHEIVASCQ